MFEDKHALRKAWAVVPSKVPSLGHGMKSHRISEVPQGRIFVAEKFDHHRQDVVLVDLPNACRESVSDTPESRIVKDDHLAWQQKERWASVATSKQV